MFKNNFTVKLRRKIKIRKSQHPKNNISELQVKMKMLKIEAMRVFLTKFCI